MYVFYSFADVARLYLAGVSFSVLCFGTGRKNRFGIMAGAVGASFCTWSMCLAMQHPFFVGPMIWFPLMILGLEKIFRKEKPYLFIICTALSAASNFYFFYMIVWLTIIYAVIRMLFLYRHRLKEGFLLLLKTGGFALIGVCMACVVFLPVLIIFVKDSRTDLSQTFFLFYPLDFYSKFPAALLSGGTSYGNRWLCLGFSAPGILALFLLFIKKKEDTFLKVLCTVCLVFMLFPVFGSFFNGMSYATNRWIWAFTILVMYILAKKWEEMLRLTGKEWRKLVILTAALYVLCLVFDQSRRPESYAALAVLFAALMILGGGRSERGRKGRTGIRRQEMLVGLSLIQAFLLAFWLYSPDENNYAGEMTQISQIRNRWEANEAAVISSLADDPAETRYTGRSLSTNANMSFEVSNTQFYWSITNPDFNAYRLDMETASSLFQFFNGYDDRTAPIALSSVRYYTTPYGDTVGMPYGYTYVDTIRPADTREENASRLKKELGTGELSDAQRAKTDAADISMSYSVYRNEYALPLGYCYNSCYTKETWDGMDVLQRQQAQLDAACVDSIPEGIEEAHLQMPDYKVPYKVECVGAEINESGSTFVTTSADTQIVLTLAEEIPYAETCLEFSGMEFTPVPEYDLYFGGEDVDPQNLYNKTYWDLRSEKTHYNARTEKANWYPVKDVTIRAVPSVGKARSFLYRHPDSQITSGRHDFMLNFGYNKESVTTITITFPERGIYSFDALNVYAVPIEGYTEKIAGLQENTLQDIALGTDTVTGTIALAEPKLLCLSVPYADGWEAFIDGEKTRVYRVNLRHQGITVPAGEHMIEFRYHTPGKRAGLVLTLLGTAALIVMIILDKRRGPVV